MTDVLMPLRRPRSIRTLANRLSGFVRGRLWLQVLVAMALGVASGFMVGPHFDFISQDTASLVASWAALPGYLFLALVQMIVIPLVVSSIILGMASTENVQQLRQTGVRTGGFFLVTTLVAVLIGLAAVMLIQPGSYMDSSALVMAPAVVEGSNSFSLAELPNRITEIVPTNPLRAGVEQNMLQMVVFSILVGVALVTLPITQARPLMELLGAVQDVSMVVVRWAMYLVPFAVFGLMFQLMTRLGLDSLVGLGMYVLTVLAGLLVMLLVYLILYRVFRREPALRFMRAARDAQLLAFSTSSSAAVMPLTIQTAIERLNVRQGIAQFVVPLGTTINMAGTALYQVVATMFLAQVFQVNIETSQLMLVVVLAVGASIGSPGTPGIGIVILSMLLTTVGIPAEGIALLIGVDRILDMCRTTLNVTGDLVAAAIMDSWLPVSADDEASAPATT
ncbi:MAG: dicarboxylate/amino acid:cation symporter [Marinobacter sp.]|nr:dicarboxylate/amino acid:cation symporter [Marinobacter sp.]